MIIAVGTDLVDVGRLTDRLRRAPRLAPRLLTPGELAACGERIESVAARLAAKEAVLKALGAAADQGGDGAVGPRVPAGAGAAASAWRYRDIEVLGGGSTAPRLALHGAAARAAEARGIAAWHLSLAHEGGAALAFVVAEG